MGLNKNEIRVFIQDEIQLQEAKEMLQKYNQPIFEKWFNIDGDFYHLFFDGANWWIGSNNTKELISLSKLKEILKHEA